MSRKAAWWLLSPRKHCAQQAEVSRLLKVDTWPPPELELLPSCVALSLTHYSHILLLLHDIMSTRRTVSA